MSKKNFWETIGEACERYNEMQEEKRQRERENFENAEDVTKVFTRGTVIAAMVKATNRKYDEWDIRRVVDAVTTAERAEAAIGLIEAGCDSWGICRIIEEL